MIDKLIAPITDLVSKLIPDKDLQKKLTHEIELSLHKVNLTQLEVNKAEAGHTSMFVSGWRPFVGWVCGISLLYHFLLSPLLIFIFTLAGVEVILPAFEFSQLSSILMGMLGLGGLRTFEKMKGVSREK